MSPKWIEAAKLLIADPRLQVVCPQCEQGSLVAQDCPCGSEKIERWLNCPLCGAWSAILMRAPQVPPQGLLPPSA